MRGPAEQPVQYAFMAVYEEKWGLPTSPTTPICWLYYNIDTVNVQVVFAAVDCFSAFCSPCLVVL